MDKSKLWTKELVLIMIVNFLIFMNHIMVLSTFPFYIESKGGTEAIAGAAATLFSLMAVICRPIVGWMLDNGRRKAILIIGLIGMALMPMGYLCVSTIFLLFVFRLVHGASLAFSNTSSSTITTDFLPKARFAEGMGFFGMSIALATSIAPAFGLALMNNAGYKVLFTVASLIMVISLIILFFLKAPDVQVEKKKLDVKHLFNADAIPASLTVLLFMLTFGMLENFVALFADNNGLPSGGVYFAVLALMLLVTRFTVGKVADRRGEGIFVYTCNAAMFVALLLLAIKPNPVTYILSSILAGYGFGGIEPALQTMALRITPLEHRGSANSTFLCAYDIGIGLGGGIAGVLITSLGYSRMFLILSLATIASILLYHLWGRKHPSAFYASEQ